MPLLTVLGTSTTASHLRWQMAHSLKTAAASVPELKITEDAVTVAFSADEISEEGRQVVVVIVELLLDKPERTVEVQQELANVLLRAVTGCFSPSTALLAEVVLRPLVPPHCFSSVSRNAPSS